MYYVYELIDPRNSKVFYVGKGKNKRMYWHINSVKRNSNESKKINLSKFNIINNILLEGYKDVNYKIIFKSENEELCFKKEMDQIKFYGLSNLTNITPGGVGNRISGISWEERHGKEYSLKRKLSLSKRMKGNTITKGVSPWNKGKTGYTINRSDEAKKNSADGIRNSKKHKDVMKSEIVRKKISDGTKKAMDNKEIREKCAYWKGKKQSKEMVEKRNKKVSLALKGVPKSDEHKRKLKEAWKKRKERNNLVRKII